MNKPLRLAFLTSNTGELPEWEMEMIRNLRNTDFVIIEAFIIANINTEGEKIPGIKLFKKFENWWFRTVPDAFSKSTAGKEFNIVPLIDIAETQKILELDLDVIYCSCLVKDNRDIESFARYGLWFIAFGKDHCAGYEEVAFWEIMNNNPEIGSALLVKLAGTSGIITVYNGTTTTVPYSVKNTLNMIGWRSSSYLLYRLAEITKLGADLFFSKYIESGTSTRNEEVIKLYKYPGHLKLTVLFLRNVFRYLRHKISKPFGKKNFTLLFSQQKFQIPGLDISNFIPIKLPTGIFRADPFVIEKEQKTYIFFEEFIYKKNRAHISVLELGKDGDCSEPVIILEKPYHLSYPFIFESGGILYMIPETSINKTVELYKCTEFPLKWEFVQNLMENVILNDSTLLYHQDKWWLFGTGQNHPSTSFNDQLFLYYSDSFMSTDWTAHPQNPVVTIISNCRPAGKIFQSDGKLFRPAQNNSSAQYGYAIKINEIEILNETEYKEREVFEIVPGKGNNFKAVHTINWVNNLIVIDGII